MQTMATISEVARILGVDRDTIKAWTTDYAEHFSLTAIPPKGRERQYRESDLRVLALVAESSASGAENDDIHFLLNNGGQHEDRFIELARLHTTPFQEVPEEIDETWQHGTLIGGMAGRDLLQVARAYKTAADELAKLALSRYEPHELDYPVLFLYRHAIELYLKSMLTEKPQTHDLGRLIELLEGQFGNKLVGWVRDRLRDFHHIDRMSDTFRYDELPSSSELWIDFHHVQFVMDRLVETFEGRLR